MEVRVTRATTADIPVIQAIANDTWPSTYDRILSAEQTQYMLKLFYSVSAISQQMLEQNQQFLLASLNGNYVGYAGYEPHFNNTGNTKLHKLYVLPGVQGKNIGKALLNQVIADAKEKQQYNLLLNVNRDNAAVGFYNRNGFEIIAREDIPIGNDYYMNDYIMQLAI